MTDYTLKRRAIWTINLMAVLSIIAMPFIIADVLASGVNDTQDVEVLLIAFISMASSLYGVVAQVAYRIKA